MLWRCWPPHHEEHKFVLFVRPKDKEKEIWSGYRVGVEQAKEQFGADEVYPITELDEHLPQVFREGRSAVLPLRAGSIP